MAEDARAEMAEDARGGRPRPHKRGVSGRCQAGCMNDVATGRALRALRRRLHLRQIDVARRAHLSQQLVSKVERGRLSCVSVGTLRRIFAAVESFTRGVAQYDDQTVLVARPT